MVFDHYGRTQLAGLVGKCTAGQSTTTMLPAWCRFTAGHSRQAELVGRAPEEVIVLFGNERYPSDRGTWQRIAPGSQNLHEGPGRLRVEQVANALRALIETGAP